MRSFPQRKESARTAQMGVDAVSSIVNDELGWLFRRTHGEDDFGVDGHIDVVLPNGAVTGQSLAVQIKSGKKFFQTKTSAGYVFYGDSKHLNYYLNSQVPVLIVLYDPATRRCIWEHFSAVKTDRTSSGWKMIIPKGQVFCASAKEQLLEIVGPAFDHREVLSRHWAFNKHLQMVDRVLYAVDRKDIENGNIRPACDFFNRLQANVGTCEKLQGKVEISVSGYDDDERELWEVPEVRAWFAQAFPAIKYWFYFLSTEKAAQSLKLLFSCLCQVKKTGEMYSPDTEKLSLSTDEMAPFLMSGFSWLNEIASRVGMPEQRNQEISFAILAQWDMPGFFDIESLSASSSSPKEGE